MPNRRKTEDDDELPLRGKVVVPKKSVQKRPPVAAKKKAPVKKKKAVAAKRPRTLDDQIDDEADRDDAEQGPALGTPVLDGVAQHSRRSLELEAQMRSRLSGEPVFPYPPELRDELKPYWQELVNSFPKDHFQVSDATLMKMYCQCAYDISRQDLLIAEEGEVVVGGRGNPIVNPRCKVREGNRGILLALTTKFRNQPASRVNTENFKNRRQKAEAAVGATDAVMNDDDGLLAGAEDQYNDDVPPTRH